MMNRQRILSRVPALLAIAVAMPAALLAPEARAADVKITHPAANIFEVQGGSGATAWHIQYGQYAQINKSPLLALAGPGQTAYFTHQNWLRRVNVDKGVVTGRWRFPGYSIQKIAWKDRYIQVEVEERDGTGSFKRVIDFDPDAPNIPYWPTTSLALTRVPQYETPGGIPDTKADAEKWLSEAENGVRRDPLSPALRVQLAIKYEMLGKPEAARLYEETVRIPPADHVEAFWVAMVLRDHNQLPLAEEEFEHAYELYLRKGNEPRMLSSLLPRLLLWGPPRDPTSEDIERAYMVGPWVNGAEAALEFYAKSLETAGKQREAELWHRRAVEARTNSLYPAYSGSALIPLITLAAVTLLAALVYFCALFYRYLPQRRIRSLADTQSGVRRRFSFFNVEYWSRTERIAFFSIAVAGWLATAALGSQVPDMVRFAEAPLNMTWGNLGGPVAISFLENRLARTPERDLLLAMAYHQDGQRDNAEALYRELPQFAESWNNLGVLLKDSGKGDEARRAFEQALQLKPELADANWNLGKPPSDLWTETHQKYLPDRAMFTPPSREHFLRAFGLGIPWRNFVDAVKGPFSLLKLAAGPDIRPPRLVTLCAILMAALLVIGVIVLALGPGRDVTQPAPKRQVIVELLFPGTAPEWRLAGGLILVGSFYSFILSILIWTGAPVFVDLAQPSYLRSFGLSDERELFRFSFDNPYMAMTVAAVVLLWAANAALIRHSRRKAAA